jgi:GT2 family glycosyltransferase
MPEMPLNARSDRLVVVIATYNRLDLLKVVVDAVHARTRCDHEIIVADGGSTDGTVEYLREHKHVTPHLMGECVGTSRTYNDVWRRIEAQYACWLSDDTEITGGVLDSAVQILEREPDVGMVGLKMRDSRGPFAPRPYMGSISHVGILNCNHGVLPLALLRDVGYFNEAYRSYHVDPDLTASVLSAGRRVVMTKRVGVIHHREYAVRESHEDARQREIGGVDNAGLYARKFAFLQGYETPALALRYRVYNRVAGAQWNDSARAWRRFGITGQDWYNIAHGTFISSLDPLTHMFRQYHLSQRIPTDLLRRPENPYRELVNST